jgi:Zn-finger nucleic acid-binding protein
MVFRETDIRPADLEAGKLDALNADLERLTKRKHEFVKVACPACGADEGVFELEKYGFKFDKCPQCRTVYMNPRATPEILADFYGQSALYEYWNRHIFPASRSVRMEKIFRPRAQRIIDL